MYRHYLKRIIDFLVALFALSILLIPLLIVTIWLHYANNGTGAFFLMERPGRNGKIFKVVKFKSMSDEKDENGNLLPDTERMTKAGRFVRSTSIDELPQLWNVLVGDMSLIGPRPLYVEFLPLYNKEQRRRHDVTPGITGWAQVNGRNLCKYSQKFKYDVWYVDNLSFTLDLKILFMTVMNVLKRKDVGEGEGNNEEVDDLGWDTIVKANKQKLYEMAHNGEHYFA